MLSKQSLRSNVQVYLNNELATKDQLIHLSESWTDKEETLFRRLLKQGGKFKIKNQSYTILVEEQILNSRGNLDSAAKPMDHTGDDINDSYLK